MCSNPFLLVTKMSNNNTVQYINVELQEAPATQFPHNFQWPCNKWIKTYKTHSFYFSNTFLWVIQTYNNVCVAQDLKASVKPLKGLIL